MEKSIWNINITFPTTPDCTPGAANQSNAINPVWSKQRNGFFVPPTQENEQAEQSIFKKVDCHDL